MPSNVIPLKKPPDPALKRLEEDKAFWLGEMKRATREYMAVCWKLAVYKQEK